MTRGGEGGRGGIGIVLLKVCFVWSVRKEILEF